MCGFRRAARPLFSAADRLLLNQWNAMFAIAIYMLLIFDSPVPMVGTSLGQIKTSNNHTVPRLQHEPHDIKSCSACFIFQIKFI